MNEKVQADDEQFPTLVYKGKGSHSRAGGTYEYAAANCHEELEAKLNDGWFATLPEAIDDNDNAELKSDDNAPPTRKELEAKAKELGIKFAHKTNDTELSAAINLALNKV